MTGEEAKKRNSAELELSRRKRAVRHLRWKLEAADRRAGHSAGAILIEQYTHFLPMNYGLGLTMSNDPVLPSFSEWLEDPHPEATAKMRMAARVSIPGEKEKFHIVMGAMISSAQADLDDYLAKEASDG